MKYIIKKLLAPVNAWAMVATWAVYRTLDSQKGELIYIAETYEDAKFKLMQIRRRPNEDKQATVTMQIARSEYEKELKNILVVALDSK